MGVASPVLAGQRPDWRVSRGPLTPAAIALKRSAAHGPHRADRPRLRFCSTLLVVLDDVARVIAAVVIDRRPADGAPIPQEPHARSLLLRGLARIVRSSHAPGRSCLLGYSLSKRFRDLYPSRTAVEREVGSLKHEWGLASASGSRHRTTEAARRSHDPHQSGLRAHQDAWCSERRGSIWSRLSSGFCPG